MKRWLPIRKVAVGLIAAGVYWGAQRAGLTLLDDQAANQAAQGLVGFVVAYLLPDPRVRALEQRLGLVAKVRWLLGLAEKYAAAPAATSEAVGEGGATAIALAPVPDPPPPA